MTTRGTCRECGKERNITGKGVVRHHWAPYRARRRDDWTCPGAGQLPSAVAEDPVAAAVAATRAQIAADIRAAIDAERVPTVALRNGSQVRANTVAEWAARIAEGTP